MVFTFVWPIAFNTLLPLNFASKSTVFLLPAIFVLKDTQIHVCTMDSDNVSSYVKTPVY